ncbi:MAG: hypothetical protein H7343_14605 [Undibacterium sp.]|nr:hypothetical protein [Opitutaceae bacterium]
MTGMWAGLWRWRVRLGYGAIAVVFLGLVARFHLQGTGFTSLLSIGSRLDEKAVPRLQAVPHYAYEDSWGYDGTYYVQLALHPLLDHPEQLSRSIDNVAYRARRILPSWAAWVLGLGRDEWIVQVFALLNVGVWFALGWVLLQWLPPVSWGNLLRWGGVMFSHGMCMSVRNSLADAPGLLLVALAVRAVERGWKPGAVVALGAALLTKETSLLAASALMPARGSGWRGWARAGALGALAVVPFAAWLGYVRWRAGANHDAGLGNFAWPLAGLAEKMGVVLGELMALGARSEVVGSMLVVIALVTQAAFLLLRPEPGKPWWRIGAGFAGLMLCVAQPVWEGYPGAATRVLLPMMLAFNLLVPRGRRWLVVLVLGNLSAIVGVNEFNAPPHESFVLTGESALRAQLKLERGAGWYVAEGDGRRQWRWSRGPGVLKLTNRGTEPVAVRVSGEVAAVKDGRVTLRAGGQEVWTGAVDGYRNAFRSAEFVLSAKGETVLKFSLDAPGVRFVNGDDRVLAFAVYDVDIAVARAVVGAKPAGQN